jgi:hypothetical protein
MRRSGTALVMVALLAACGPSQQSSIAPRPIGNQADPLAATGSPPIGEYLCSIQEGGYEYPPFRCIVGFEGGRGVLEKVEGSVRFRGVIASTAAGFRFDGEVYCPWGDCTEPVSAEFRSSGGGLYIANFATRRNGPAMTVVLEPSRYAGYGGDYYGGYGYGGYGGDYYGGYGYGGYGYGGYYP